MNLLGFFLHNWGVSTVPALGDVALSNVSGGGEAMETSPTQT